MEVCNECGGRLRPSGGCNLCELFATNEPPGGQRPSTYPMKSMALGIHPDQIPEVIERNRKHGCNVTYQSDGQAIIPDAGEHKKIRKLDKCHFNNSFN